jgi:hypothetical protein
MGVDGAQNCVGLYQSDCDVNGSTPFSLQVNALAISGASKRATWLTLLDRLSTQYPHLTLRLSAAGPYGRHEKWTAHNGALAASEMCCNLIAPDLRIVYIRNGQLLDPPEFAGESPVEITTADLLRICESTWRAVYPDRDCPGEKSGALWKKAEAYVARRVGQSELPSAEVFQLWQEIAAKPKDGKVV